MVYIYILGFIIFTVYTQIILKWRIPIYGELPDAILDKVFFVLKLYTDPFIFSSMISGFIASLFWMAALTKLELSYAFPFTSLSFVLIFVISIFVFNETFTYEKLIGIILITLGIIVTARSM